jgi:hypothetical protein
MNENLGRLPEEPKDRSEDGSAAPAAASTRRNRVNGLVNRASAFHAVWETPVSLRFGAADLSGSLRHGINDGLMTLFFFIVALELKREIVLGELRNPRVAALSVAGAIGPCRTAGRGGGPRPVRLARAAAAAAALSVTLPTPSLVGARRARVAARVGTSGMAFHG